MRKVPKEKQEQVLYQGGKKGPRPRAQGEGAEALGGVPRAVRRPAWPDSRGTGGGGSGRAWGHTEDILGPEQGELQSDWPLCQE